MSRSSIVLYRGYNVGKIVNCSDGAYLLVKDTGYNPCFGLPGGMHFTTFEMKKISDKSLTLGEIKEWFSLPL